MLTGQVNYPIQVFIKQVTLVNQIFSRLFHQPQVLVFRVVSLFDGLTLVSGLLPFFAGGRERNHGTPQRAAGRPSGANNLSASAYVRVTQVPTGVGGQWHSDEREADA